jgi:murein DD-endopeptidase MepM/ murein hydrolase activator NlpD
MKLGDWLPWAAGAGLLWLYYQEKPSNTGGGPARAPTAPPTQLLRVLPVDSRVRQAFASRFNASHRGIDIFAPAGTAVFAVDDGEARAGEDPKGGHVVFLKARSGASFYFAHLRDFAGTFPRTVKAGERIGSVGTSGNAQGKDPHLHFEVRPSPGADTVDPFPHLQEVMA